MTRQTSATVYLGDQLLSGPELADDLRGCVPGAFYGRVHGPVWPAEVSHSHWTARQSPRQRRSYGVGYDKCDLVIDHATRLAYVEVLAEEQMPTMICFLCRAIA